MLTAGLLPAAVAQEVDGDYRGFGDAEGFWNVMPPGQKGVFNAAEALAAQAGQFPPHSMDQAAMYDAIYDEAGLSGLLGLSDGDIERFFKEASFGTPEVERSYSPTDGLVIVRDGRHGVPHVRGETREATMFGAGYAGAEDRLFLMDVLRHLGRGRLSELLGASDGNRELDREQLAVAPYLEEDLSEQVDELCGLGQEGQRICDDAEAFIDGVNAFVADARQNPDLLPAEYPALQQVPEDFVAEDIVAIASLVGGIFGRGGGGEIANGRFLAQLQAEHGEVDGRQIFGDFRSANDPEAPHTTERAFPYNNHTEVDHASTAVLDLDTVDDTMAQMRGPTRLVADGPLGPIDLRALADPLGMSNAVLAAASVTDGGVPIAVFGPQTGYFTPQLLVELDVQGPGISARGVSFAGTHLYIQLGRGRNYAWSATSAGGDNVDQWVLRLCEPDGSEPTAESQHYEHNGECQAMEAWTQEYLARPTAGGFPPTLDQNPILIQDEIERSVYGPVVARGTVDGAPVAIAVQRSTYGAELRSAPGFLRVNDPDYMAGGASSFLDAFDGVDYTFNWFYVDEQDIAYKHSCLCPIRHPQSDPDLPTWGTGQWDWTGQFLSPAQQPHEINPARGYFVNWNNKQAPRFRANDANHSYSSTYRSEFLRTRIEALLGTDRKLSRADVLNVAMDAATVDLNGQEIYPLVLRVLGDAAPDGDQTLQAMRDRLAGWVAAGGHRRDTTGDGEYDDAVAVAIGDALLRPLLDAVFGDELAGADWPERIEDHPDQAVGSAYNGGRANFLHRDLRQVLGDPVAAARSRTYCGGGDLGACRTGLWEALAAAADALADEYDSDDVDDWAYDAGRDAIVQSAVGVVQGPDLRWVNRPTFHQVAQPGSRIGRLSGATRIRTAASASRHAFPDGADVVVVASAAAFPDALSGTPLAHAREAPLLLSSPDGLSPETAREVARLGAGTAIVLGGEGALAAAVDEGLRDAGIETVQRVFGATRYETAAAVAAEIDDVEGVIVASGERFPDALASGPLAAVDGRAILLTQQAALPEATAAALEGIDDVIVAGGSAAVADAVLADLQGRGLQVRRVFGADRYATALALAREALDAEDVDLADVYTVTGADFPDAIAAGATAARTGGVVLLLNPAALDAAPGPAAFLRERRGEIDRLWLVGGQAVLPPGVRAELEGAMAR